MRDELKYYLKHSLKRNTNSCLYASYISKENKTTNFDIENILFYNVGPDSFKDLAKRGLIFERRIENPIKFTLDSNPCIFDHYMNYKVLYPLITEPLYWKKDKPLVSWSNVNIDILKTDLKPFFFWLKMKKCKIDVYNNYTNEGFLGISINIKVPKAPEKHNNFNFVTILKPMIDGIMSSFHTHNGKDIDEIANRLSKKSYLSPKNIKQLLMQNEKAVLGQKDLIRLWGNSVQWNPSDDLINYGELKIDYSQKSSIVELDGELFYIKLAP